MLSNKKYQQNLQLILNKQLYICMNNPNNLEKISKEKSKIKDIIIVEINIFIKFLNNKLFNNK